jgi:hypothetical protein
MPRMQKPAVMRDNSNGYQFNCQDGYISHPIHGPATLVLGFDIEEKEGSYIKSHTEMVSHCWACALKRRVARPEEKKTKNEKIFFYNNKKKRHKNFLFWEKEFCG